jgi:hypothetical protein
MLLVLEHYQQRGKDSQPKLVQVVNEEIRWKTNEHFVELTFPPQPIVVKLDSTNNKRKQNHARSNRGVKMNHPALRNVDNHLLDEQRKRKDIQDLLREQSRQGKEELRRLEEELRRQSQTSKNNRPMTRGLMPRKRVQVPVPSSQHSFSDVSSLSEESELSPFQSRHPHYSSENAGPRFRATRLSSSDGPPSDFEGSEGSETPKQTARLSRDIRNQARLYGNRGDERMTSAGKSGIRFQSSRSPIFAPHSISSPQTSSQWSPQVSPSLSISPRYAGKRGVDDEIRPSLLPSAAQSPKSSSPGAGSNGRLSPSAASEHREGRSRATTNAGMEPLELDSSTDNEDSALILKSRASRISVMRKRLHQIQEIISANPSKEEAFAYELEDLQQQIEELVVITARSNATMTSSTQLRQPSTSVVSPEKEHSKLENDFGRSSVPPLPHDEEVHIGTRPAEEQPAVLDGELGSSEGIALLPPQPEDELGDIQDDTGSQLGAMYWMYPTFDWAPFVQDYTTRLVFKAARPYLETGEAFNDTETWAKVIPYSVFQDLEEEIVTGMSDVRKLIYYEVNDILQLLKTKVVGLPRPEYHITELLRLVESVYGMFLASKGIREKIIIASPAEAPGMMKGELLDYIHRLLKNSIRDFQVEEQQQAIIPWDNFVQVEKHYADQISEMREALFLSINQVLLETFPGLATNFQVPAEEEEDEDLTVHTLVRFCRRPDVDNIEELADQISQRLLRFDSLHIPAPGNDIDVSNAPQIGDAIARKLALEEEHEWAELGEFPLGSSGHDERLGKPNERQPQDDESPTRLPRQVESVEDVIEQDEPVL